MSPRSRVRNVASDSRRRVVRSARPSTFSETRSEETDHFREFEAALPDLLAGEPEVTRFEVDSATEMEL
ncbi:MULTISPECIES: hypothetical protein [unclassified Halorubrum]|uniref:hypothetical protein n=1 Tax=unclassified Halorubrum TaxID=2642239 RepID=UPI000B994226|nr:MULTISPECIES: hypothetical protein [unclassified Halorubrum]OYR44142.1 hypothetical protein DJ75_10835 [Halorubrum sp. Eb13]OYR46724.1 hypothetical protein DJ81_02290 [Halorubrum sp. Hd13]OYR47337.1 hypothetical protein DJ74_13115 [Halorubrum sp. Ea8]